MGLGEVIGDGSFYSVSIFRVFYGWAVTSMCRISGYIGQGCSV